VFTFERLGVDDAGKVQGRFKAVCKTPKMLERIRLTGITLPPDLFDEVVEVNL
jgi:pilus assembly protein CpaF